MSEYGGLPKSKVIDILELTNRAMHVKKPCDFGDLLSRLKEAFPYERMVCLLMKTNQKNQSSSVKLVFDTEGSVLQEGSLFKDTDSIRKQILLRKLGDNRLQNDLSGNFCFPATKVAFESPNTSFTSALEFGGFSNTYGTDGLATLFTMLGYQEKYKCKKIRSVLDSLCLSFHRALIVFYFLCKNESISNLTNREVEVLRWIKEGKTNWEISRILNITERTVKYHTENIYKKLGVSSRTHAVRVSNESDFESFSAQFIGG